jgi:hypothetical protein
MSCDILIPGPPHGNNCLLQNETGSGVVQEPGFQITQAEQELVSSCSLKTQIVSTAVLKIGRYMPVYRTGNFFVPEFHTGTYQYILYEFIFFSILTIQQR